MCAYPLASAVSVEISRSSCCCTTTGTYLGNSPARGSLRKKHLDLQQGHAHVHIVHSSPQNQGAQPTLGPPHGAGAVADKRGIISAISLRFGRLEVPP